MSAQIYHRSPNSRKSTCKLTALKTVVCNSCFKILLDVSEVYTSGFFKLIKLFCLFFERAIATRRDILRFYSQGDTPALWKQRCTDSGDNSRHFNSADEATIVLAVDNSQIWFKLSVNKLPSFYGDTACLTSASEAFGQLVIELAASTIVNNAGKCHLDVTRWCAFELNAWREDSVGEKERERHRRVGGYNRILVKSKETFRVACWCS